MSVVYSAAVKTARMGVVRDAIDGGGGSPNVGAVILYDGASELARVLLDSPGSSVTGPVLSFEGLPLTGTGTGDGVADNATIVDSDDVVVVSGLTVGLVSDSPLPDVVVDNTSISVGQSVILLATSKITHG